MTERSVFLSRLADRLATSAPPNLPHPLPPTGAIPEITYARPIGEPVAAFMRAADQAGSKVKKVDDEAALEDLLDVVLQAEEVDSVTISRDPETAGIAERIASRGVAVVPFDGPASIAGVGLGIVGAAWGLAATGTTVFDSGRAGGRTASLLPPAVLVLLSAGQIVPHAGTLFRSMDHHFPGGLPSQLVLASGPSRTGDIELVLTLGVHGPRAVWVGVLAPSLVRG